MRDILKNNTIFHKAEKKGKMIMGPIDVNDMHREQIRKDREKRNLSSP